MAMQFPQFRGFGPTEAIKQLSQWVNQPMLTQALKEAAQKLGIKEVPPLASVQEMLRVAGRWVEAAVEPWSSTSDSQCVPGINATGELFSLRWTAPRLSSEGGVLSNLVHTNFTEDRGVAAHLKTLLMGETGASDVLVTPNLAIALQMVSQGLSSAGKVNEIVLPRLSCLRFPAGASHGGVHVRAVLDATGIPVHELGTSTDCQAMDYERGIQDAKKLLLLLSPSPGENDRNAGIACVRAKQGMVCEVAIDGSLHDLHDLGINATALSRRWDSGIDILIVPGQFFMSGPECGIILGRLDAMEPIRNLAEQTGMQADRATQLLLCEAIRSTLTLDDWKRAPTGASIATSLENLENRARRIALQCEGTECIERIDVEKKPCKLGSGIWQTVSLESAVLSVFPKQHVTPSRLAEQLASHQPPIWSHVLSDRVELVMRTIDPAEDHLVVHALQHSDIPSAAD